MVYLIEKPCAERLSEVTLAAAGGLEASTAARYHHMHPIATQVYTIHSVLSTDRENSFEHGVIRHTHVYINIA